MAHLQATALIALDGPVLRDPDGVELLRLGDDGRWRTPDGVLCDQIGIPTATPRALVSDHAQAARNRELDAGWLAAQLPHVVALARAREEFTADDVWAIVTMPPRQSKMIGQLLQRAAAAAHIEPTDRYVPSSRRINNGRRVRVWRSLANQPDAPQPLDGLQREDPPSSETDR